jgi:hypothetical protein
MAMTLHEVEAYRKCHKSQTCCGSNVTTGQTSDGLEWLATQVLLMSMCIRHPDFASRPNSSGHLLRVYA